jgi:ABC-2 type transport system permease protein
MDILNKIKFEFKIMLKSRVLVYSYFISPIVLTILVGYLAQNSFGSGISSYEYYSINMMLFVYMGSGNASLYNFIDKPMKQGNLRVIFTPIKTVYMYLSQIVCGTIFCVMGIVFTTLVFKLLFKINYHGNEFIIFALFSSIAFVSNAASVFLCTTINNFSSISIIITIGQSILCVLGGAFFSLETLGKVPATMAKLSPVKYWIDGVLNSMYDNNNSIISIAIFINVMLGIIFIIFCKYTFKTEKYI